MEKVVEKKKSNVLCIFCQMPLFGGGKMVKVAHCGHVFHLQCFDDAVKK